MFIRIHWGNAPAPHTRYRKSLRKNEPRQPRASDDLGIPARDFDKMTRSLFDRQD